MLESAQYTNTWRDKFQNNLKTRQAWRFVLACMCFATAPISLIILFVYLYYQTYSYSRYSQPWGNYGFAVCGLALAAGTYFFITWRRCNELTVAEALLKDPRPPIIYLRPFKADRLSYRVVEWRSSLLTLAPFGIGGILAWISGFFRRQRAEELLVEAIEPLGPVVAIGRPGERVPPMGAARLYVGDEWKDVVRDFMKKSHLILMVAGTTPHFAWEIGEVFRNEPFVPTIIMLPFFTKYRQEQVDQFISAFDQASGLNLPKDLRKTRAAYFPSRDTMLTIDDDGSKEEKELNSMSPLLGSLARIMDLNRPGWRASYIEVARSRREYRARTVASVIGALFLVRAAILLVRLLLM